MASWGHPGELRGWRRRHVRMPPRQRQATAESCLGRCRIKNGLRGARAEWRRGQRLEREAVTRSQAPRAMPSCPYLISRVLRAYRVLGDEMGVWKGPLHSDQVHRLKASCGHLEEPHDASVGLYGQTPPAPAPRRGWLAGELATCIRLFAPISVPQARPGLSSFSHRVHCVGVPLPAQPMSPQNLALSPWRAEQPEPFVLAVTTSTLRRLAPLPQLLLPPPSAPGLCPPTLPLDSPFWERGLGGSPALSSLLQLPPLEMTPPPSQWAHLPCLSHLESVQEQRLGAWLLGPSVPPWSPGFTTDRFGQLP